MDPFWMIRLPKAVIAQVTQAFLNVLWVLGPPKLKEWQWQMKGGYPNHGDFCDSKSDSAGQMEVPSRLSGFRRRREFEPFDRFAFLQ